MLNTIKIFYGNLSKGGKITLWVILQLIVIIILISVVSSTFQEKERVEIENEDTISSVVPKEYIESFKETLWELISNNVPNADRSVVDDIVVRDDSYEEIVEGKAKSVNFIIDIDSIKQTFMVSIGWSEDSDSSPDNNIGISCPPKNKMKYPETVCYGMYNNTYSLDLYLPHSVYPEGYEDDGGIAPNYMITGDEYNETLDIMVSTCDAEGFKEAAWNYLDSLPIDFSNYTVNYEMNSVDVRC